MELNRTQVAKSETRPWQVLLLSAAFVLASLAAKLVPWWGLAFLDEHSFVRNAAAGILALTATLALTLAAIRWKPALPDPRLAILPPSRRGGELAAIAMLMGALLFAVVFLFTKTIGGMQTAWAGVGTPVVVAILLRTFVSVLLNAAWEEYAFRGWAFSVCVKAFGPHRVALALGTAFGLFHLLNPQSTALSIASVALAGYLLSYLMLAFRNILVPIGFHVGWNYCQSILTTPRLWGVTLHSNTLLSGGDNGLEGTLVAAGVTGFAAFAAFTIFRRT